MAAEARVAVGDVILATDFEGAEALSGWTGSPRLGPGRNGGQALFVERTPEQGAGSTAAQFVLPVEKIRGCVLNLSGWIRAEAVSEKPNSWNGIKYMAPIVAEGGRHYPQAQIGVGTFDWKKVMYSVRVPPDATDWRLHLGLEAVTGRAWFDDLRITVRKLLFVAKAPVCTGPPYRGHDLPRLRGAMISPRIDEESLKSFALDWKANVVRWQLVGWRPQTDSFDLDAYDRWLEGELAALDAGLPRCEKYGLYVVVDLHAAPGGGPDSGHTLFNDADCQRRFIDNWRKIAARYRDHRAVWGYDLLNEPNEQAVDEGLMDWQALAEAAAKVLRAVDATHAIIVEPPAGGGPDGFVGFNPIDVPNVVYSVHMYLPHAFTHQGVHGEWTTPYSYPGEIGGQVWDKARVAQALKPAVDFQKAFNVHLYAGEFSAIRWAPANSAYRYLKDCIEVFEENGWDWTYHAFREWNGWSVEHGPDRASNERSAAPTDRQLLLQEWYGKNVKPSWPTAGP